MKKESFAKAVILNEEREKLNSLLEEIILLQKGSVSIKIYNDIASAITMPIEGEEAANMLDMYKELTEDRLKKVEDLFDKLK